MRIDKQITKNFKGLMKLPTRDTDGDGVPNIMDCEPYNPKKQGVLHDIKTGIKDWKTESNQKRAAERLIRKKSKAEYYREKEKQSLIEARERAKIERKEKLKSYRKKLSQPRGTTGFFSQGGTTSSSKPSPKFDAVTGTWSYPTSTKRRTTTKRKTTKRKTTKRKRRKR